MMQNRFSFAPPDADALTSTLFVPIYLSSFKNSTF